ncbi:MAG: hypothetical protein ACJAXH_003132, partial [Colwellia sp.]
AADTIIYQYTCLVKLSKISHDSKGLLAVLLLSLAYFKYLNT